MYLCTMLDTECYFLYLSEYLFDDLRNYCCEETKKKIPSQTKIEYIYLWSYILYASLFLDTLKCDKILIINIKNQYFDISF